MKKIQYIILLLAGFMIGCRERYDPPVNSLPNSFLVVEGVLNAGQDSTSIRLTRTFKLDQNATVTTEDNAQLTVEGKDNSTSSLTGSGNGYYVTDNLHLVPNNEYRLRIKTVAGKEYVTDYVTAKITPPIDSIGWDRSNAGVQIYANTKDPSNTTRYYRWEYEETWEIHSNYFSQVVYENGVIRPRQIPQESIYYCWKYNNSSSIVLANSIRLQDDVIYKAPIKFIASAEERLGVRYSILIKQYALEQGAYDFFDLLKKNTEDIGSLFNPQPSEIRGNIHCVTDPSEYVIGYLTASTIEKKRIFITNAEVDPWGFSIYCESVTVPNIPDSVKFYFEDLGLTPYYFHNPPGDYFLAAYPICVDCRVRGGSTTMPSFW